MQKIEELRNQLQLTEDEDKAIEFNEDKLEEAQHKGDIYLIGKIWVKRMIDRTFIEAIMVKLWRLSTKAKFQENSLNTFVIWFANYANTQRIEDGRPQLFNNNYFVIEQFDGYTQLEYTKFEYASIWLQLHNVPLNGVNRRCGQKIRESNRIIKEISIDDDDVRWEHTLRIKVHMDLTKPIALGRMITIIGKKYWITVQYEK